MSWRRWVFVGISFAATLGVTLWVLRRGDAAEVPRDLSLPAWAHLAAFAAVLLEITTRAVKIQWAALALHIPLRFATALRVCLGGDFAASITPARSGAEPARFVILVNGGTGPAPALLVLFAELLLETWSLVFVCVVFFFAFEDRGAVVNIMNTMIVSYALLVLALGAIGYGLAHSHARGPVPGWAAAVGLHAGRWRAVQLALRSLRTNLSAFRTARQGPMFAAFVASLVHVGLKLALLPILAITMDPSLSLAPLALWGMVFLYGGAIAPAPGGGGAVEFGFQFAFRDLMSPAVLASTLVWWRFYSFYLYIMLGGLSVGTTVLRALRSRQHGRLHERTARRT